MTPGTRKEMDELYKGFLKNPDQEEPKPMAITQTADQLSLMRQICESPQDDTPRLMYADMLDELAELKLASGTPRELVASDQSHAELIRLQIGVANGPPCICGKTGLFRGTHEAWCELNGIEVASTDIKPTAAVEHRCPKCDYRTARERERWLLDTPYEVPSVPSHVATRVRIPLPKLKGRELWKPVELMTAKEVRYVRGFVGIVSYSCDSWLCRGRDVVRSCPVEVVVLADRILRDNVAPYGSIGYMWAYADIQPGDMIQFNYPGMVIPKKLWVLANALRDKDRAESVQDSYKWLSWASIFSARKEAGMFPWCPRPPSFPPSFPPVPRRETRNAPVGGTGVSGRRTACPGYDRGRLCTHNGVNRNLAPRLDYLARVTRIRITRRRSGHRLICPGLNSPVEWIAHSEGNDASITS